MSSDVIILVCPSMNGPSKANSVEIEIMRTQAKMTEYR